MEIRIIERYDLRTGLQEHLGEEDPRSQGVAGVTLDNGSHFVVYKDDLPNEEEIDKSEDAWHRMFGSLVAERVFRLQNYDSDSKLARVVEVTDLPTREKVAEAYGLKFFTA